MSYIQPYKVWLPTRNTWDDEYESWIERSYTSRRHDGLYDGVERDVEDDDIPVIPIGSELDDLVVDNAIEL